MKYYSDGFLLGSNPSLLGGGYTIVDENNSLIDRVCLKKQGFTNNEAEIQGILNTLKYAKEGDSISTDSMCALTWVHSGKSKARSDLNLLLSEAKILKEEKNINLMWEARKFNLAGIYNEKNKPKIYASSKLSLF